MKYHNKRRVRKVFTEKQKAEPFEPITAEWYRTMISELTLARHRRHVTQMNLANMVGTSQAEISRIELGKTNPTVELLDRLFSVLDLLVEIKIQQK